ncbi:hypothetical protein PV783_14015 [Chitinophaga sp. CC14]|uniref:hypothetical protein n=1 Tax=Chitinophaga sp. CC14 TaxID=3029199 RepID=UPI003B7F30DB
MKNSNFNWDHYKLIEMLTQNGFLDGTNTTPSREFREKLLSTMQDIIAADLLNKEKNKSSQENVAFQVSSEKEFDTHKFNFSYKLVHRPKDNGLYMNGIDIAVDGRLPYNLKLSPFQKLPRAETVCNKVLKAISQQPVTKLKKQIVAKTKKTSEAQQRKPRR